MERSRYKQRTSVLRCPRIVAYGPKPPIQDFCYPVAIGGKADIRQRSSNHRDLRPAPALGNREPNLPITPRHH